MYTLTHIYQIKQTVLQSYVFIVFFFKTNHAVILLVEKVAKAVDTGKL